MPSIETDEASVVLQVNCTWSPAEITVGEAVNCAVGAGAAAGGGAACGGGAGCFFLHPETATKAASRTTAAEIRLRIFNVCSFLKSKKFFPGDPTLRALSRRLPNRFASSPCFIQAQKRRTLRLDFREAPIGYSLFPPGKNTAQNHASRLPALRAAWGMFCTNCAAPCVVTQHSSCVVTQHSFHSRHKAPLNFSFVKNHNSSIWPV